MGRRLHTSRNRQREAECAGEHCIREHFGAVTTVRAAKTRFVRQDLFAADVLGKDRDGNLIAAQVTCGDSSNVAQRRRKMEAVPWAAGDTVLLFEYRENEFQEYVVNKNGIRTLVTRKSFRFRVHRMRGREWAVRDEVIEIPKEWFRAWKDDNA